MKKVLSVVLAVVLAFGMATVGFAAAPKIKEAASGFGYSGHEWSGDDKAANIQDNDAYLGDEVRSDSELKLIMSKDMFVWENVATQADAPKLTKSHLSSASITVKKKVSKGGELVKDITIDTKDKEVFVKIKFIDPYVSTSSKDFDFTVYLAKKGSKMSDTDYQITGTMENEIIEVDEGDDEVNLSEGQVAKALAYVKAIKVDAGNGLFINTKFFEDKKYYAKATQDITASDDAVVSKYPEIDTIYTLNSVNMSSAGNTVEFDIDDRYYVYNSDGKYIGTTADKLPFSSKYYLAVSRISMDEEDVDGEDGAPSDSTDVEDYEPGPITGGDDVPANANDNPGTGANGFVNVAAVAGLAALAVAAVSKKK